MTDAAPPPPGWYSGGTTGEERWWDGTQWTELRRPLAPPRFQYSGSVTGSVIAAAVCGFIALVLIALTLLVVISNGIIAALVPGFATIVVLLLGGLALVNALGLRRRARDQSARDAER